MTVRIDDYRTQWRIEEETRRLHECVHNPDFLHSFAGWIAIPRMPIPVPPWLPYISPMSELDVIHPLLRAAYEPNREMIASDLGV